MITVEKPVTELKREIDELENLHSSHFSKSFTYGAIQALLWILQGGPSPSDIMKARSDPANS